MTAPVGGDAGMTAPATITNPSPAASPEGEGSA